MVWAQGHELQDRQCKYVYVIGKILGQGGFGITYKAWNRQTKEYVVIKTPNEHLKHDPDYDEYVKKFKREAEMLKKFSAKPHPHIVCIRNFFQGEDNYCLVMDFVDGETLFEVVRKRGRIPEKEAIKYIQQIGTALGDLHKVGAVHRDAHPGNIMIGRDGKAILIDFGIAKDLTPTTQTSTGNVGNKGFAPYEQLVRGSREPAVDVYCLAATFYFILTGKRPTNALDRKLNNTRLIPPKNIIPSISNKVNKSIIKGMALEAKRRPNAMEEWLKILAPPPSPSKKVYLSEIVNKAPSQEAKQSNENNKTKGELSRLLLTVIAIVYAIASFILASFTPNIFIWLLYLAAVWALALADGDLVWVWDLVWVLALTLAFLADGDLVWVWALALAGTLILKVVWANETEEIGFEFLSRGDRLFLVFLTSSVGTGLGWLAWCLYSLLN